VEPIDGVSYLDRQQLVALDLESEYAISEGIDTVMSIGQATGGKQQRRPSRQLRRQLQGRPPRSGASIRGRRSKSGHG
jgi:hypothetical protein